MTLNDFEITEEPGRIPYVKWDNIKKTMRPAMYETWAHVSRGSTSYIEGAYAHDIEKFLRLYEYETARVSP